MIWISIINGMICQQAITLASDYYDIPVAKIERVIQSGNNLSQSQFIGPMHIPVSWIPVLSIYGFSPQAIETNECTNIEAGTWILGLYKRLDATQNTHNYPFTHIPPRPLASPPNYLLREAKEVGSMEGVPYRILLAIAWQESGFNPNAVSYRGAQGLMQFMPGTWARFGSGSPFNTLDALIAGARYIKHLYVQLGGNWEYVIAGYNAGGNAVIRYGGIPPYRQTMQYVPAVLSKYASLVQQP